MDWAYVLDFISEITYLLIVFGAFLLLTIAKGRQAIINVIVGLYLALLITIEFPYYDWLFQGIESDRTTAAMKLAFFAFITALTTLLCRRIMPDEFNEGKFESLGAKFLLAAGASILVLTFSFHVLPVTDFLTPGTPLQSLFGPEGYFFWWLLLPMAILYLV